jgi:hypothetical protein
MHRMLRQPSSLQHSGCGCMGNLISLRRLQAEQRQGAPSTPQPPTPCAARAATP